MNKTIYVGNLPFDVSSDFLREMFEDFGEVQSVRLIADRGMGRSKGFGFVTMAQEDAETAIAGLNNMDIGGRRLKVEIARDKKPPCKRVQEHEEAQVLDWDDIDG